MKFFKRNKITIIFILLFILLVFVAFRALKVLVPDEKTPVYGDRLDKIEEVKISDETYSKIKEELEGNSFVESVTTDLEGKIVYVVINVNDETKTTAVAGFPDVVLAHLSDEQKAYYDIQVLINKKYTEVNNKISELEGQIKEVKETIDKTTDEKEIENLDNKLLSLEEELDKYENGKSFPMIAYKNANSDKFVWTKSRGNGQ